MSSAVSPLQMFSRLFSLPLIHTESKLLSLRPHILRQTLNTSKRRSIPSSSRRKPSSRINPTYFTQRRAYSAPAAAGPSSASTNQNESLTQKLRRLLRENGKVALGVYLGLSAIDFSLTFLAIYALGAEHVKDAEDWVLKHLHWKRKEELAVDYESASQLQQEGGGVVDRVKDRVGAWAEKKQAALEEKKLRQIELAQQQGSDTRKSSGEMGSALWTTAVLAYAIHKTALLPFRIGVTAAVTPAVVRWVDCSFLPCLKTWLAY